MGIALFSFANVSARLRAAWQAWSGHPGASAKAQARGSKVRMPGWRCIDGLRVSREPHAARSVRPRPAHAGQASQAASAPRPLRVVQVLEQHPAPAGARARHWNGPARADSTAARGAPGAPAAEGGAADPQEGMAPAGNGVRAAGLVASRMVISGRLADVCAELERLAALEGDGAQALLPTR